jgi:hypothetical protein
MNDMPEMFCENLTGFSDTEEKDYVSTRDPGQRTGADGYKLKLPEITLNKRQTIKHIFLTLPQINLL